MNRCTLQIWSVTKTPTKGLWDSTIGFTRTSKARIWYCASLFLPVYFRFGRFGNSFVSQLILKFTQMPLPPESYQSDKLFGYCNETGGGLSSKYITLKNNPACVWERMRKERTSQLKKRRVSSCFCHILSILVAPEEIQLKNRNAYTIARCSGCKGVATDGISSNITMACCHLVKPMSFLSL